MSGCDRLRPVETCKKAHSSRNGKTGVSRKGKFSSEAKKQQEMPTFGFAFWFYFLWQTFQNACFLEAHRVHLELIFVFVFLFALVFVCVFVFVFAFVFVFIFVFAFVFLFSLVFVCVNGGGGQGGRKGGRPIVSSLMDWLIFGASLPRCWKYSHILNFVTLYLYLHLSVYLHLYFPDGLTYIWSQATSLLLEVQPHFKLCNLVFVCVFVFVFVCVFALVFPWWTDLYLEPAYLAASFKVQPTF